MASQSEAAVAFVELSGVVEGRKVGGTDGGPQPPPRASLPRTRRGKATNRLDYSHSYAAADEGLEAEGNKGAQGTMPSFWSFRWLKEVRPLYILPLLALLWLTLLACIWVLSTRWIASHCQDAENDALVLYTTLTRQLQEAIALHTLSAVTLGTFARTEPFYPTLASDTFPGVAHDLLDYYHAVSNLQLAPAGVVSSIVPLAGNEAAIGHDLFMDPNRRADALATVSNRDLTLAGPFPLLQGGVGLLARYPVFIDGPVTNRTEEFGFADAYDCYNVCYGDPMEIFWGFTTALLDWEVVLEDTGLNALSEAGVCYALSKPGPKDTYALVAGTDKDPGANNIYLEIPVPLPNAVWMLSIGFDADCAPWAFPLGASATALLMALLLAALWVLYLNLRNSELRRSELRQLQQLADQRDQAEALAASDKMRKSVDAFAKFGKRAASIFPCSGIQTAGEGSIKGGVTVFGLSQPVGGDSAMTFRALVRVSELRAMETANPDLCRLLMLYLRQQLWDIAGEHKGTMSEFRRGNYIGSFRSTSHALAFALNVRRAVMSGRAPAATCTLPGCAPRELSVKFQKTHGPPLQILVDMGYGIDVSMRSQALLSVLHPWQILVSGEAIAQLSDLPRAGYPFLRPLGMFILRARISGADVGDESEFPVKLFEAHEPRWDLHLPQIRFPEKMARMKFVCALERNLCAMPKGCMVGPDATEPIIAVVLLQLELSSKRASFSTPSIQFHTQLEDAVHSMLHLFNGYLYPSLPAWASGNHAVAFFPNPNCAMAFAINLQMMLACQAWDLTDAEIFGKSVIKLNDRETFAGPRVRCAIGAVSQSESLVLREETPSECHTPGTALSGMGMKVRKKVESNKSMGGLSTRRGTLDESASLRPLRGMQVVELLSLTYGGQILVTGTVVDHLSLLSVTGVDLVDLGEHRTGPEASDTLVVKELRVHELGPRKFPRIPSLEMLSLGYEDAPDPTGNLAFLYCQVVARGGPKVSSSPQFIEACQAWRALCRSMLPAYGGYESGEKGLSLILIFSSLHGAVAFAVTMQRQTMDIPLSENISRVDGYHTVLCKDNKVLFRGLGVKVGISFGTPVMKQPLPRTGRASYYGPNNSRAVRIMTVASPGQVLVDGTSFLEELHIPAEKDGNWVPDGSDWLYVAERHPDLCALGCTSLVVRDLGDFRLENEQAHICLLSVALPELAARNFSAPPNRISGGSIIDPVGARRTNSDLSIAFFSKNDSQLDLARTAGSYCSVAVDYSRLVKDMMDDKMEANRNAEEKVQIISLIGQGSQGKVMAGMWKGIRVAYKITQLYVGSDKRSKAETRALMELAISATMSHPNIVQTYSAELVEVKMGCGAEGEDDLSEPLLRPANMNPKQQLLVDTVEISAALLDSRDGFGDDATEDTAGTKLFEARIIQELCVGKTLRDQLDSKSFVRRGHHLPDTATALRLALDVACGMSHMHSLGVLHADLKAQNVLLNPSTRQAATACSNVPNMIAKISDFGLSMKLSSNATHLSNVFSGTITHMAPEVLLAGQASKAADVYAFGILMYEIFSGKRAFEKMNSHQVTQAVTNSKRPVFPAGVPLKIIELACECWGPVSGRPTFDSIIKRLNAILRTLPANPSPPISPADSGQGLPHVTEASNRATTARVSFFDSIATPSEHASLTNGVPGPSEGLDTSPKRKSQSARELSSRKVISALKDAASKRKPIRIRNRDPIPESQTFAVDEDEFLSDVKRLSEAEPEEEKIGSRAQSEAGACTNSIGDDSDDDSFSDDNFRNFVSDSNTPYLRLLRSLGDERLKSIQVIDLQQLRAVSGAATESGLDIERQTAPSSVDGGADISQAQGDQVAEDNSDGAPVFDIRQLQMQGAQACQPPGKRRNSIDSGENLQRDFKQLQMQGAQACQTPVTRRSSMDSGENSQRDIRQLQMQGGHAAQQQAGATSIDDAPEFAIRQLQMQGLQAAQQPAAKTNVGDAPEIDIRQLQMQGTRAVTTRQQRASSIDDVQLDIRKLQMQGVQAAQQQAAVISDDEELGFDIRQLQMQGANAILTSPLGAANPSAQRSVKRDVGPPKARSSFQGAKRLDNLEEVDETQGFGHSDEIH